MELGFSELFKITNKPINNKKEHKWKETDGSIVVLLSINVPFILSRKMEAGCVLQT